MARQTITPSLAKWGLSANDMSASVGANQPISLYSVAWTFKKTDTGPVIAPFIPPQGLIRPGKDEVDVDLYVVWASMVGGGLATQKAGWVVAMTEDIEDSLMVNTLSPVLYGVPTLYKDDNGEVDWGWAAGPPDVYASYPYVQYGLAYGVAGDALTLRKTKVASFKMSGGALAVDRGRRSFGKLSGTVNGKQGFGGLYIWRAQSGDPGATAPAIFGAGVFDADGDGQLDTDDFDDDVILFGVVGEFK